MKLVSKLSLILCLGSIFVNAMDEDGWASIYESIAAFEDRPNGDARIFNRPNYVKPIITNLGNVLNSNWYVSASIPESPSFEAGLPFAIIPIGDDDQTFNENGANVPTIFGTHGDPMNYDPTVYGNETLNGLGVFTYPYLQLAGSYYHARLVLRGMWLPSVSELKSFSLLGFGLQYSFGHFFQYMLPPAAQGLDVSLVFGYNSSSIGYQPEDYEGQLDLDISALTFDVVIGYKINALVEVMMTLGYQSATMESSGHLISHTEGWNNQTIDPNLSIDGNCGFKFGLEVAFQIGSSFHPVVGFDYAGKSSFTTNILYFKQQFGKDKTPDEIAKEKGYVRGGKKSGKKADDSEDEDAIDDTEEQGDDESFAKDEAVDTAEDENISDEEETPKAKKKKKLKAKKKTKKKKRVLEEDDSDEESGENDDFDEDF